MDEGTIMVAVRRALELASVSSQPRTENGTESPTTLTFRTPSRRCPFRNRNGMAVTIAAHAGKRYVKRADAIIDAYWINDPVAPDHVFTAFADELFIVPNRDEEHPE